MQRGTGSVEELAEAVESATHALVNVWSQAVEGTGVRISTTQLSVLYAVHAGSDPTIGELAGALGIGMSSVSRLCDRLEAAGLLVRETATRDRRVIHVRLTGQGGRLLEQIRHRRREGLAQVLAAMTPAARAALLSGLSEFQTVVRSDGQGYTLPRFA
ncbi:MAG: MarR family transcriptional regulator [Actinocatenispora sp.]